MCSGKETGIPAGKLITFEGIDCAGKSSIVRSLCALLTDCRVPIVACGEFGSPLAPILRDTLQEGGSAFLKTYLFASDRAWTHERVCLPAIRQGSLVLWDRYVDSAIAYRAAELTHEPSLIDIDFVRAINGVFMSPDLIFYIDVTVETSFRRTEDTGKGRPYNPHFLASVREEYLARVVERSYVVIDGERDLEAVTGEVAGIIRRRFKELF